MKLNSACAVLCALLLPGSADAAVLKAVFAGANCSFSESYTGGFNRNLHGFRNTSGADQWITCPTTRIDWWSRPSYYYIDTDRPVIGAWLDYHCPNSGYESHTYSSAQSVGGATRYVYTATLNATLSNTCTVSWAILAPNGTYVFGYGSQEEN